MKLDDKIIKGKQYIDRLRNEYIEKHTRFQERDELIAENNIEKRDIKGYHGREILELLQNADDAYQKSIDRGESPQCKLKVTICYKNNVLTVTNTGTCFDEAGIKAIVQGNNSPKSGKYIGNKGTGFRSVLNWAEKVRIFSGNFSVEFSKEIADKILEELKDKVQIQKQIKRNSHLYIPVLAVPYNIENRGYSDITTIEVVTDPTKLNDDFSVSKQLENIDLRILLFLPNISQIDIITDDNHIIYRRNINTDALESISLEKTIDGNVEVEESFYLFKKIIQEAIVEDDVLKDIQLSIAVPKEGDTFRSRYIYSFFPLLDTESPFACVLHASYALGDHRNTVNVCQENKDIIEEQILFLVEVANEFANKDRYDIAYELLIPTNFSNKNWRFTSPFAKFELEDFYLDLLAKQKIFLTVNKEKISIKDNPRLINGNYPKEFVGKGFERLLQYVENEKVISFIEMLASREKENLYFKADELLTAINLLSNKWNVSQQVDVFIWWNRRYRELLPNLLKTQDGKWLAHGEDCYFLIGDFDTRGLPSWVKIPALHKEYQRELFIKSEETQEVIKARESDKEPQISRIICQNNIYPTIGFKYRDRSNIISAVNSSVDTYNKAIDFIRWLWRNYRKEVEWNPPGRNEGTGFKYNFPNTRDKSIQDSEKLFFGSDYGNALAEKLFDNSYGKFPSPEVLNISVEDKTVFKEFISKFGVKDYPTIEVQPVSPMESYSKEYEMEIKMHGDVGSSTSINYEYCLPYIKNLEDLLKKLSTSEIVEWIIKDFKLYDCLCTPFYSTDNKIKIGYQGKWQHRPRYYRGRVKNYILEVFNEVRWVEIEGKRYSPRQILRNINSRSNQRFKGLVPIINVEMLEEIAVKLKIEFNEVFEVFKNFSFGDRITDLSSEDFYKLMLKIPSIEFSRSMELSKAIYRIVEQSTFTKQFEDSDSKERFFEDGEVLVKYQGQLQYVLAKEAFLPSQKIISKKNVPIVDKGQRTNNENFVTLFGCKEYNKEYSIDGESINISPANAIFQEYYHDFQKYACAYLESNKNIEKYGKHLKITLVDEISILEAGKLVAIDEEYVCISDKVQNWYITVFDSGFDINAVSEIIENIYTNIANTPGFEANASKLGELFRAKEKSNREFLIKKEFGSLSVIEDVYYKNEIRNNFIKTLKAIAPTYEIEKINIDFDDFYSIKNGPCIIALFRELGTDVDEFKKMGFAYKIDLVPYFSAVLREFLQNEKRRFKDFLYTRAMLDEKLQGEFLHIANKFEQFVISDYKNSVEFNVEENVVSTFGEWRTDERTLSAYEEYAKNYEEMNPSKLCEVELSNDLKAQQMIYFGQNEEFNKWLDSHQKLTESEDKIANPYLRYKNIVPKVNEVSYHQSANAKVGLNHANNNYYSTGVYTHATAEKRRKNQKILGNKGELLVYNLLCKQVGKENVFPRSEAFVELGILKPGQAISGEYDISYIDVDGIEYYAEVKTGDGKSFIISPGELQYAKENAEKYELFIVYDLDAEQPNCMKLPTKFWEDSRFRKKEIVERIEFEF